MSRLSRPSAPPSRARTLRRWATRAAVAVLVVAGASLAAVYGLSEWRLRARVAVPAHGLHVAADAATRARGEHLARIHGCTECHAADLGGRVVLDEPLVATLPAPNLTGGGRGAALNDVDWERAVRHGVDRDGRPLVFMPAHEFAGLADDDLAAIVAYARTLPPQARRYARPTAGPLGRLLFLTGDVALVPAERVAHARPHPRTVPPAPTAAYGAYLAAGCIGCHGPRFTGGPIAGAPPDWPPASDLTPAALGRWSEADFRRALRDGRRPDGTPVRPPMPLGATRALTDVELAALWSYLRTLPAQPTRAG